jgi:hypothetical protein
MSTLVDLAISAHGGMDRRKRLSAPRWIKSQSVR